MDNQHKRIKGYRDLTEFEVATMNQLKDMEAEAREALSTLDAYLRTLCDRDESDSDDLGDLLRWVDIARTNLETGFMYAIKAVARPTNGLGRR